MAIRDQGRGVGGSCRGGGSGGGSGFGGGEKGWETAAALLEPLLTFGWVQTQGLRQEVAA